MSELWPFKMWIVVSGDSVCGTTHKVTFIDAELPLLGVKPATFIANFCVFQ